ncbi:MAG: GNAT family N-acetyltransferase [Bacteroidota bacterium]
MAPPQTPFLESERLYYRWLSETDRRDYLALSMSEAVMRHITGAPMTFEAATQRFDNNLLIPDNSPGCGVVACRLKGDQSFVGVGKVVFVEDGRIEIGYSLMEHAWGQGLGSEIAAEMVRYARQLNTHELMAITDPVNAPSNKILERLGFEFERSGTYKDMPAFFHRLPLQKQTL